MTTAVTQRMEDALRLALEQGRVLGRDGLLVDTR